MKDPESVKETATYFAKAYKTDEEFFINGCKNVYYVTLEDEANFMGLKTTYAGMTGQELYSKMARTYSDLGKVKAPLSWNKVSDTSIIEGLMSGEFSKYVKGDQSAEEAKTFTKVTEEIATREAISNKKLTIEFPSGSDILDGNARALIEREFVGIAKEFSGARIRIEGNTDNTGSDAINRPLSKRRAQAVADYLVKGYGFDPDRFIIVGNGSAHAIAAGSQGPSQEYRTTDFQLISE
jgi:NitT/TauT family transport system substrate-binding protein